MNLKFKKKIGLAHGVFDLVHSGHLLHFEECKKYCDELIVSITDDKYVNKGPGRPYFNSKERVRFLQSIKFIDKVIINNDYTPINLIKKIKPDFYFKGKDYLNFSSDLTGNIGREKQTVQNIGGKIIFTKSKLKSSSSILNNQFDFIEDDVRKIIKKIDKKNIINFFYNELNNKFKNKILIFGDPIIDKYTYVEPLGKSQKNQIIVTKFKNEKIYGGGSLLVSIFLMRFFGKLDLISIKNNFNQKFYKKFLPKNINKIYIKDSKSKMTIKNRFISYYREERLYQINHNDDQELSKKGKLKLISFLKKAAKNYDKIIIFDFGHGLIDEEIVRIINKNRNKFLINCQSNSSNFGFNIATKYKGGHTICMDEMEFRLCVRDNKKPIDQLIKKNLNFIKNFTNFIITRGKEGCYLVKQKKIYFVPTIYKTVKDTTGSGDVFFSTFVYFILTNKLKINEIIFLSHIAAGLHASEEGNQNKFTLRDIFRIFNILVK